MSTSEIIFSDYGRSVRCSAQSAAVLNARLHKVAPHDLNQDQKRALRVMGERADEVREVQALRERFGPAKMRPLLALFVNGFSAVYEGLVAASRVTLDVSDRGERATAVLNTLFADGVSFTQLDAESAWSEGARRLERIKVEGLKKEIDTLIGEDLLATAVKATAKLADAIGTGQVRPVPTTTALQESLSRFGRSVGAYGRAMAATVDEDDEASVDRFVKAMTPIDQHRAALAQGRGSSSDNGEDVETPVVSDSPSVVGAPTPIIASSTPPASPITHVGTPAPAPVAEPVSLVA
jgi:hypothetical protein